MQKFEVAFLDLNSKTQTVVLDANRWYVHSDGIILTDTNDNPIYFFTKLIHVILVPTPSVPTPSVPTPVLAPAVATLDPLSSAILDQSHVTQAS